MRNLETRANSPSLPISQAFVNLSGNFQSRKSFGFLRFDRLNSFTRVPGNGSRATGSPRRCISLSLSLSFSPVSIFLQSVTESEEREERVWRARSSSRFPEEVTEANVRGRERGGGGGGGDWESDRPLTHDLHRNSLEISLTQIFPFLSPPILNERLIRVRCRGCEESQVKIDATERATERQRERERERPVRGYRGRPRLENQFSGFSRTKTRLRTET